MYSNHAAIDGVIKNEAVLIRPTKFDECQSTGQRLVVTTRPFAKGLPGLESRYLLWGGQGFLKSIQEVLPEGKPSPFNESNIRTWWTLDISEALQFTESESARYLCDKGVPVEAVELRLAYSSGKPEGWLGSLDQFPAQKKLSDFLAIQEVAPING